MKYTKTNEEVYGDEFVKWLNNQHVSDHDIYHSRNFPKELMVYEQSQHKLLPEFTKEDVIQFLGSSLTIYAVKRFYNRSKLWIKYCIDTNLYDTELSEDDLANTFLYSISINDYKEDFKKNQKFITQQEFVSMLNDFLKESSNYILAMAMILLWEGLSIEEACSIKKVDCNYETGEYKVNGEVHKLSIKHFLKIFQNALNQTQYSSINGKTYTTVGTVYLLRSTCVSNMNKPINKSTMTNRFVVTFMQVVGKEYLTAQDLQTSGRLWRMYVAENEGKNVMKYEHGGEMSWWVTKQYARYKEYIASKM